MVRGLSSARCRHSDKTTTRLEHAVKNMIRKYFGGYRPQQYSVLRHLAGL